MRVAAAFLSLFLLPFAGVARADDLSAGAESLVKLVQRMGGRKRPLASEERKLAKLLDEIPGEELAGVLARLRDDEPSDALRELIGRLEARERAFRYPGAGALPDFAELLASAETADRCVLLRKLLAIEDLGAARALALESVDIASGSLEPTLTGIDVIDRLIGLGETDPRLAETLWRAVKTSKHPAVRCVAANGIETAGDPEIVTVYLASLDDVATQTGADPDGERGATRTFSFGARAWYRLTELSGLHPATDHDEYLKLDAAARAAWRAELEAWWTKERPTFRFHRSRWERFATEPVVHRAVVSIDRPGGAAFTFRASSDRALVKLELTALDFADTEERWRPFASWTLSYGIGGARNAHDQISGKRARVGRRTGGAKPGIAWFDVAVQRIGLDRARIVVRYADFIERSE